MEIELIYKKYSPKIFRLCYGYLNDHDKAKDLTQDTFISVIENYNSFKNKSSIGTWIFRIATNKCLRQLENENRKLKLQASNIQFDEINLDFDDSVDKKYEFLIKCISELSELDRLIIGLHLEGLHQEKIGSILGMTHSNVRVKIHRIKKELINIFNKNGRF